MASAIATDGHPVTVPDAASAASRKAIIGVSVGNLLEWYDFGVYGFFAVTMGKNFFAAGDPVASLLASFAVFGIGFVARPLGGLVMGFVADKRGRRSAMMITIMLMAIGTLFIGIAPTYATAGVLAPLILVVARLMQGFATGGEWGAAAAFCVEWAPNGRRGLYGAAQQSTGLFGIVVGSTVAAVLSTLLSNAQIDEWGWRIPFLLGALIGPVGFWIRRTIAETPAFEAAAKIPQGHHAMQWGPALRLFCLMAVTFAVTYTYLYYLPTFTQKYGGLTRAESLWANSIAVVAFCVGVPFGGRLSDRLGRKPVLLVANLLILFLSYPLMAATVKYQSFVTTASIQVLLNLFFALYCGAATAAYVEMFPTIIRLRWLSPTYNLAGVAFGAFAPYIATWLVVATDSPTSVVYFVLFACVLGLLALVGMRETAQEPLR
jgi:MFS family permease